MTQKQSNGKGTPKTEVKTGKTTTLPAKVKNEVKAAEKPSYEELTKRIVELEKAQASKPKDIQEVINFFELKKEKINRLEKFKSNANTLNKALEETKEDVANNQFDEKRYTILLNSYNGYNDGQNMFKVSNPVIISECLNFLIMKINENVKQLEIEIQQDF